MLLCVHFTTRVTEYCILCRIEHVAFGNHGFCRRRKQSVSNPCSPDEGSMIRRTSMLYLLDREEIILASTRNDYPVAEYIALLSSPLVTDWLEVQVCMVLLVLESASPPNKTQTLLHHIVGTDCCIRRGAVSRCCTIVTGDRTFPSFTIGNIEAGMVLVV